MIRDMIRDMIRNMLVRFICFLSLFFLSFSTFSQKAEDVKVVFIVETADDFVLMDGVELKYNNISIGVSDFNGEIYSTRYFTGNEIIDIRHPQLKIVDDFYDADKGEWVIAVDRSHEDMLMGQVLYTNELPASEVPVTIHLKDYHIEGKTDFFGYFYVRTGSAKKAVYTRGYSIEINGELIPKSSIQLANSKKYTTIDYDNIPTYYTNDGVFSIRIVNNNYIQRIKVNGKPFAKKTNQKEFKVTHGGSPDRDIDIADFEIIEIHTASNENTLEVTVRPKAIAPKALRPLQVKDMDEVVYMNRKRVDRLRSFSSQTSKDVVVTKNDTVPSDDMATEDTAQVNVQDLLSKAKSDTAFFENNSEQIYDLVKERASDLANEEDEEVRERLQGELRELSEVLKTNRAKKQKDQAVIDFLQRTIDQEEQKMSDLRVEFRNNLLIAAGVLIVLVIFIVVVLMYNNRLNHQKKEQAKTQEALQESLGLIAAQNQKNLDSMEYAQTIQEGILPNSDILSEALSEYFVIFKPKDVVSGDFYWCDKVKQDEQSLYFVCVVDCTGHGVPGAFMSMIGHVALREVILGKGVYDPDELLEELDELVVKALRQDIEGNNQDNSMEICLCVITKDDDITLSVEYAGAKRPLMLLNRKTKRMEMLAPTRRSIAGRKIGGHKPFKKEIIPLDSANTMYLISDGITDQVGGEHKRKLGTKNFIDFLIEKSDMPMKEQGPALEAMLKEYQGKNEQRDDITVIGMRI